MVDEQVAASDLGEEVVVRDPGRKAGGVATARPDREVGAVELGELRQLRQVEQAAHLVDMRQSSTSGRA